MMLRLRERANRDRRPSEAGARRSPHPAPARERRWAVRAETCVPAAVRPQWRTGIAIEVVNLSPLGCAIRGAAALPVGARAWIRFPGLESWHARVAWSDGQGCGLDFAAPLHRAVAEMIAAQGRSAEPSPA